jgi:nucleoside-diphosphate-sugar epimerase
MNIIVTGSTGFIGKALVKRLLNDGHKIHVIIRPHTDTSVIPKGVDYFVDKGNINDLKNFFLDIKPDGIIHLASLFLLQHQPEDIDALITSNVLFGTRLLEASAKSGVNWFINTGTFWQHYNNADYSPVNLYAATKQAFEDIAKYYYETQNINFVTIKLNDTFGSNDTRKKIFNLWKSLADSTEPLGMSPGEQIIDISYIENIIDAYILLIEHAQADKEHVYAGQTFCMSANERMSLKELAKMYEEATNSTLNIIWGARPYRDREVMLPWDKGIPVPGWKQKISLKDAISKVINGEEDERN